MTVGAWTNINDLINAVEKWLDRTDLSSMVPQFVTLTEADINRRLRTRSMETSTDLTTVGGTATVALPTDFIEARSVVYAASTPAEIPYYAPGDAVNAFAGDVSGEPRAFTVTGTDIRLYPTPDGTYTITLRYYARPTSLNSATNWVFQKAPDVYLYGCLYHASVFTMDDKRKEYFRGMYDKVLDDLNIAEDRASHPSLVMRPTSRVY